MLKPLGGRLLGKIVEPTSKSGIILTSKINEDAKMIKVLEVGEKNDYIKVGDIIFTNKFTGSDIKYEREDYTIVRYEEVLGVLEEKEGD